MIVSTRRVLTRSKREEKDCWIGLCLKRLYGLGRSFEVQTKRLMIRFLLLPLRNFILHSHTSNLTQVLLAVTNTISLSPTLPQYIRQSIPTLN